MKSLWYSTLLSQRGGAQQCHAPSTELGTCSVLEAWCKWLLGRGQDCSLGRILHRFIKRKKFDDELVESSLAKSSTRAKGASGVEPGRCSGSEPSSSEKKKVRNWEMWQGGGREKMGSRTTICQLA